MKIGTKSVLFGAHCFFLHPFFVARAWWKLYGFPFDPRLWVAFFVHDLGYIGKPNMDGPEGETHPYFGARIMQWLFDWKERRWRFTRGGWMYAFDEFPSVGETVEVWNGYKVLRAAYISGHFYKISADGLPCEQLPFQPVRWRKVNTRWYIFTLYHSRFLAKKEGAHFSRLCVADKLAITLTPAWLYLPLVNLTGEITEYMKDAARNSNGQIPVQSSQVLWYRSVQNYVDNWVAEHKDLKTDTWTTAERKYDQTGVYQ